MTNLTRAPGSGSSASKVRLTARKLANSGSHEVQGVQLGEFPTSSELRQAFFRTTRGLDRTTRGLESFMEVEEALNPATFSPHAKMWLLAGSY